MEPHSSWADAQQLSDEVQVKGMLKGRKEQNQIASLRSLVRVHVLWVEPAQQARVAWGQGGGGSKGRGSHKASASELPLLPDHAAYLVRVPRINKSSHLRSATSSCSPQG